MLKPSEAQHELDMMKAGTCSCEICKDMCLNRACWPTPVEAQKLIDAGFGDRLMLDWWVRAGGNIYLLCPAQDGCEGGKALSDPRGRCALLTSDLLCPLHEAGLKPSEGRLAMHNTKVDLHALVAATWDTDEGRKIAREWIKKRLTEE